MEYKSYFKTVGGNEGSKCKYPTRLDVYGCGCQHDCSYCYAKSLLEFRGLWNPKNPHIANVRKIVKKIGELPPMQAIRLGGMTDCFQPAELKYRVSLEAMKALRRKRQPYLIVTKSDIVARDEYLAEMDDLTHVQITVTMFDDERYRRMGYEKAPPPSARVAAIEKLHAAGVDVQLRLSPYVPEFVDYEKLAAVDCDKILVEFLRVNSWIEKWFGQYADLSGYTVKQGGYRHLPLERKLELLHEIHGFDEVSVCEDEDTAYQYWKTYINPNPDDCCNLRG